MAANLLVTLISLFVLVSTAVCSVYFEEKFLDDSWKDSWVYSKQNGIEFGKFVLTSGRFFNDPKNDMGLQTSEDARFYALSRKFTPFSNEGKPLVIQFSIKHEQKIDCGGGYVKLFDCSLDQAVMHGETPYEIMFGPDVCGSQTGKVHAIFNYKGQNHPLIKGISAKEDVYTHFYTLIVKPDNTYQVLIDNKEISSGSLEDDWEFLPPKKLKDPNAVKPEDWDERSKIPDPDDKKPEDWEKPENIPDPNASKPADWDDEMDGEWEPPMIDNPDYKGEWAPKRIDNPNYKGLWKHPEIDNPDYKADSNLYLRKEICAIGLDLWQVKSGSIFDNILLTDDIELASKIAAEVTKTQEGEKLMKEFQDAAEKPEEKEDKDDEFKFDDDELDDHELNNNKLDGHENDDNEVDDNEFDDNDEDDFEIHESDDASSDHDEL